MFYVHAHLHFNRCSRRNTVSLILYILTVCKLFTNKVNYIYIYTMLPQGRRAVAVRVIDQRLGQSKDGHFYERKVTLLSREDQIEGDFESQVIVVCLYSGICLCACTKKGHYCS